MKEAQGQRSADVFTIVRTCPPREGPEVALPHGSARALSGGCGSPDRASVWTIWGGQNDAHHLRAGAQGPGDSVQVPGWPPGVGTVGKEGQMPQAAPSQGHSENRWPTCGGSSSPWASALQWQLFGSHFPRRPAENPGTET